MEDRITRNIEVNRLIVSNRNFHINDIEKFIKESKELGATEISFDDEYIESYGSIDITTTLIADKIEVETNEEYAERINRLITPRDEEFLNTIRDAFIKNQGQ